MQTEISGGGPAKRQLIAVPAAMSNRDFLGAYARPGCVGLVRGTSLADRAIARAQRHVPGSQPAQAWTHAFVFSERRSDGELWVLESDLQIHRKQIQLGVQENRVWKYYDETAYASLAVLDFGLSKEQAILLLKEALNLLSDRTRYSLRELFGTLIALKRLACVNSTMCWRATNASIVRRSFNTCFGRLASTWCRD
jgi:hypothetical protein